MSSQDSSATIASPTAFTTREDVRGKFLGQNPPGRVQRSATVVSITIQNPLVLVTMSEITWKVQA